MSCFTFHPMRASLQGVAQRSAAAPAQRLAIPLFSGLHSTAQLPSTLTKGSLSHSLSSAPQNGSTTFMMRHGKRVPRLGRPADQRKALVRGLTTEVLRHGRIKTTKVKAKAIRKYVDKMITLAKNGSLHARRQALAFIYDEDIVTALFAEATNRYSDRSSGYCRVITEFQRRRGDGSEMAIIELV